MWSAGLSAQVRERAAAGRPLRVGLVGAGAFGTMFLAQARRLPGLHVLGVADLDAARARRALERAGWAPERCAASAAAALSSGGTWITDDALALIRADGLDVVVEATGSPSAGIAHALEAIACGRHVVMVTVEADVLAGPPLARRAARASVVYSLAYGDQPALICELVEWARACGLEVVCAGKGTKYLPAYHRVTPDEVWEHYGFTSEVVARGGYNARMFTSFLDTTKSAIEMAAVCNATGLLPQDEGLQFPPAGVDDLPQVCRPRSAGGWLSREPTVEVVSSLHRDGRPVPRDLRWGVFVIVRAPDDYVGHCFAEYGLLTDDSGTYAAMYRPYHLVGLEVTVSVLRAGLRGEPTGHPGAFVADVVAAAKRDLDPGVVLDGEGGYCVYGALRSAEWSLREGALPVGLTHGARLLRPVRAGEVLRWPDVAPAADDAVRLRQEMEREETAARGQAAG
ncbi:MAG: SAF domain-containing protein [Armatimonadota bacterium]|nr:SAF domain-containing protein [Armatimonadota bacterium]